MSARIACGMCVFGQNDVKMKKATSIFGILVLVGSFLNAFPQQGIDYSKADDEFLDSVFSIAEVNVVEVKNRQIIKAQTLDGIDLERLNSQSVADALRYFSGVQIKDYGGIGGIKTVNIRSMGTNHLGVFYNGIQLGNAQNGQVDLGRYSLDNIESISLYNGQKSEIFQSAKDFGSSSSIYITTKKPHFLNGEKFHVTAQFKTGSFGLINPSLLWEQKLTGNVHLSLNAELTKAHGRYKFRYRRLQNNGEVAYDTTAIRENGDVQAFRGEAALYGYIPEGKWSMNAYFYDSERGIPGAIVNNVFRHGERQWDTNAFGQGSFEKQLSDFYKFRINGKFAWDFTHYLRDDEKELYINNKYYQKEAYLSFANLFSLTDWWKLSLSGDGQVNWMDADLVDFAYPLRFTELVSVATSFEINRFSAQASLLGTFIQDRIRAEKLSERSSSRHELSPAVFLSYKPMEKESFFLNGFFKKIFRMPTFNDLYYTEIGNAKLKPEYTYQYDLGFTYYKEFKHSFWRYINFRGDGYFNKVTNKIVAYPTGQQFRWTMLNLGEVEIVGTEVSADLGFKIRPVEMKLYLQYTYQKARDFTDPADAYYGHQIPYIPWHSGSVTYNANYKGWDFNYSFIYTGERYNQQENVPENYEQPWYTHDLSLSKEFPIKKCRIKITGEVNNVFNQNYDVIHNFPMPGRNYKLVLKFML